jgi:hypothetical protein
MPNRKATNSAGIKPPPASAQDDTRAISHGHEVRKTDPKTQRFVRERLLRVGAIPLEVPGGANGSLARLVIDYLSVAKGWSDALIINLTGINVHVFSAIRSGANMAPEPYRRLIQLYHDENKKTQSSGNLLPF